MSNAVMSYWVNFAASGDVNGPVLPEWPTFDSKEMKAMTSANRRRPARR